MNRDMQLETQQEVEAIFGKKQPHQLRWYELNAKNILNHAYMTEAEEKEFKELSARREAAGTWNFEKEEMEYPYIW